MMWKWIRLAAILLVAADYLTPQVGLINAEAQAVPTCSISISGPSGAPTVGSQASLLATQKADQVVITGGCVDGVNIGSRTPVTVNGEATNFTRAVFIMSGFAGL
jgi:hypothetical protein